MDKQLVITKLKSLAKWSPSTGDSGPFASQIDWEKDKDGNWVSVEDIDALIKWLEENA